MNIAEYLEYLKERVDAGRCPACDGRISLSTDRAMGYKLVTCSGCGFTHLMD